MAETKPTDQNNVKPITPETIGAEKRKIFPDEVISAFNELIAKHWRRGSAKVVQSDVVALIVKKGISVEDINRNGWLHVEEIYNDVGWEVEYDMPAFDENYEPFFLFNERR